MDYQIIHLQCGWYSHVTLGALLCSLTPLEHTTRTVKHCSLIVLRLMMVTFQYANDVSNSRGIAKIWAAVPQIRADRRKDRVETTPEQLAAATAEAEISSLGTWLTCDMA